MNGGVLTETVSQALGFVSELRQTIESFWTYAQYLAHRLSIGR